MTCSSCGGPSDNTTAQCSFCAGADVLAQHRDAAKPAHDHYIAQQYAASQTSYRGSVGSGMSTVWMVRVGIGVFLLLLKLCVAASH